jgi:hypothetical protein
METGTHASVGAETGNRGRRAGFARSTSLRVLPGIAALALAGMMLALLASCGSDHRTSSARMSSASRIPAYAKPRVYVVGRGHRSHAAQRPQATRRLHRRSAATDASDATLTRSFPLGTQAICCRTHPGTSRG